MIYETDTDMVAIWNGTAWRYISAATPTNGTVLQVVNASTTTQVTRSSNVGIDTGLTATITPKSSSTKILVTVFQNGVYKNGANSEERPGVKLFRGSTEIANVTGDLFCYTGTALFQSAAAGIEYLDSPATTSATTYKTQIRAVSNQGEVGVQANSARSTITLREIAG
jgi:hypothetical protein